MGRRKAATAFSIGYSPSLQFVSESTSLDPEDILDTVLARHREVLESQQSFQKTKERIANTRQPKDASIAKHSVSIWANVKRNKRKVEQLNNSGAK